jgi:hypothetical protein
VIFAHVPLKDKPYTVMAITDRGDACKQFDGLTCVGQPFLGTSLVFRVSDPFEKTTRDIGPDFSARWLDFQGVRELYGPASAGKVTIEQAEENGGYSGTFDLTLPKGNLKGGFGATYCVGLRDYYVDCTSSL